MILKRLEDAQADNDPIFGVIAGTYTNHCGQTDSITRPHEGDQASIFKRIVRHADVNPLGLIEPQLRRLRWLRELGVITEAEARIGTVRLTGRHTDTLQGMGHELEAPYVN